MFSKYTPLLPALAALWCSIPPANAVPYAAPAGQCGDLHIICLRATGEPAYKSNCGVMGYVAYELQRETRKSLSIYALPYLATGSSLAEYEQSNLDGYTKLSVYINSTLTSNCPNTPWIMMGYSQGAQVIADVLGGAGGGTALQTKWTAVDPNASYMRNFKGAVLFGDPRYNVQQKVRNYGSNVSKSGRFARTNAQAQKVNGYLNVANFCDKNDYYCASGNSLVEHHTYNYRYTCAVLNWAFSSISTLIGSRTGTCQNPSPTPT